MAVAMVIFTMHGKPCIDWHNLKKGPKFSHSKSRDHNDEVAEVSQP